MHVNVRMVGAGVAAAVAAGVGYALLLNETMEPEFRTIARDGGFSVRDYPELLVAEAVVPGPREVALSVGFTAIADYLFDLVAGRRRLPMAVPLLADGDEDGRGWRTRIVLPRAVLPDELPEPDGEVRVRALRARRIGALRFAGECGDAALDAREDELRRWIDRKGLSAAGPVEHAFYNPPFTPAPLRRTEVLIPLAA